MTAMLEVEIPVDWEIVKGERSETIMLRLRHKPLAAAQAEGSRGGTTVLLVFSPEMATDLANDLLRHTAGAPPAGTPDS